MRKIPVYQHWGVPILPPLIKDKKTGRPSAISRSLTDGFIAGLCWEHVQPGSRRVGFPSWSWTGWKVTVRSVSDQYTHGLRLRTPSHFEVLLEDQQGNLVPAESVWTTIGANLSWSNRIHIFACTVPVTLKYEPEPADPMSWSLTLPPFSSGGLAYWATIDISENVELRLRFCHLQDTSGDSKCHAALTRETFLGVILGETHDISVGGTSSLFVDPNIFVMITRNTGEYFERIGHTFLSGTYHLGGKIVSKMSGSSLDMPVDKEFFEAIVQHQERQWICLG